MPPDAKTPEQKIRRYLERMRDIRAGNPVNEVAYYGALEELLNAVGAELKPQVHANFQLGQRGHGQPDFGLFAAGQIKRGRKNPDSDLREKPDRGAGEVKGLADDLQELTRSEQVGKYLDGYGLVLATNYRGFALVERDRDGKPVILESRELADSEEEFWRQLRNIPNERGPALWEFLRRAMTRNAPISKAEDVANLLASYAREAADDLQTRSADALAPLREALESSLGIKFEGDKGDHFFRSTLVQTVFYGLFSAWMESAPGEKFEWESAGFALKTPVIRTLFSEIINPVKIRGLGLRPLLDSAAAGLNRVENKNELFGDGAFDAIQYFYEPFLAAFDPKLRKDLGVWYTPPEIVRYMVRRVDAVLKTELNLPDGLADERVRVLDPCGGTGAYLVETLRVIGETLKKGGKGETMASRGMKRAAKERVFGFEILPASFVVAHWQIGALLAKENAPLNDDERAAVYLTNSLTGWEKDPQIKVAFPELADERAAAGKIKREENILVIIGNPPYNAYAGTASEEEGDPVAPYKKGLQEKWGIRKFNLDDLYVRFFRIAENRIVKTGRGIVSYISNYSYTTEKSFVVMRQSLLDSFDKFWIENMHGNRKMSEYAPDGRTSESVFAMRGTSPGIQQGVVVSLALKTGKDGEKKIVRYRDDIDAARAEERRAQLLCSLDAANFNAQYAIAAPKKINFFSLLPLKVREDYLQWPTLAEFFKVGEFNGMLEMRSGALIDIERKPLEKRMRDYFNPDIEWAEYQAAGGGLAKNAARFDAQETRQKAVKVGFNSENIARYGIRPFDFGHCYYTGVRPIWNDPRPTLWSHVKPGNCFLLSRKRSVVANEGVPMFFTSAVCDYHFIRGDTKHFPIRLWSGEMGEQKSSRNLSELGAGYLSGLGYSDLDSGLEDLFYHALAIGYSGEYRLENADGLRIDWPRIPLPESRSVLENSAALGRQVAGFLDSDSPMAGVDSGEVLPVYAGVGILRPDSSGHANLRVEASWGYRDGKGKVYPNSGMLGEVREWTAEESRGWGAAEREALGGALDVYLNGKLGDGTHWSGVPESAWNFHIGGYQAAKKWLSYRQVSVLGRDLRDEEALHFTGMIRRLSGLVLLGKKLDENYRAARDSAAKSGK